MARLQFGTTQTPGDRPVIASLPCFLPLGPGQSLPVCPLPFTDNVTFRDTFPLLEVYRNGLSYARRMNGSNSVTIGGPLFLRPNDGPLPIPAGEEDPFTSFRVLPTLPATPRLLSPISPEFARVSANIAELSETIWIELGGNAPLPVPPGGGGGGLTAEHIEAIVRPIVASQGTEQSAKDRDQAAAAANMGFYYQLMFGGFVDRQTNPLVFQPAILTDKFQSILEKRQPIPAANTFKEEISPKSRR